MEINWEAIGVLVGTRRPRPKCDAKKSVPLIAGHPPDNEKGPREALRFCELSARDQFTRVQVWPPQNMPPKAQPCTRIWSLPRIATVES